MSKSKTKDIDNVEYKPNAAYELMEPFFDGLVLWGVGDCITFVDAASPVPSSVPLNEEADYNLRAYHKARGVEDYTPPLSELSDSLDGSITVSKFNPGDRRNRGAKNIPAFPKVPGTYKIKSGGLTAAQIDNIRGEVPKLPIKDFNRAPK